MTRSLSDALLRVGSNTLVSRILGFVRDVVVARIFGAGMGADAFFVAFRIPNFLRRLFAEGAFSQGFVPVLAEYRERRSPEEVRELVAHVTGALGAVLLVVTALGVLAAPVLVAVFAPGFLDSPDKYELTVGMVRITFPYIAFISLTALAGGVLNTYGRFGVPAFTPVLLNLSMIGAALWLAPRMAEPVTALAWGVFIAGIAQLAFQAPFLYRLGLLVRPRLRRAHAGVRRVVALMIPAAFGASVAQFNLLIDTLIASFLVTGSVSWLYYSDRLVEFPLGLFGIALATVILPSLSGEHARGAGGRFSDTLDWALRAVLVVAVPSAVGLAVLAEPILITLFQYGEFRPFDARMASLSLMAYSAGLVGFVLVKILAPGYFARQDTRTPVRIGLVALGANLVLNLALVVPLAHAGLALATSLAALLNAGLLYRGLRRGGVHRPRPGWGAFAGQVAGAATLMAVVVVGLAPPAPEWAAAGLGERATRLVGLVGAGAGAYALGLALLGMRPRSLRPPPVV